MSCAPLCVARLSRASSCRSSAAPRSRIRACRRCSTRSSHYLPSPLDIPAPVADLASKTDEETPLVVSDDAPVCGAGFKIVADPFVGRLTYFRVYSGTLSAGSYAYNATKGQKERIGRLLQMHANHREDIERVYAGDICAAVGLKNTFTGDTLCDAGQSDRCWRRSSSRAGDRRSPSSRRPRPTRTRWALRLDAWPKKIRPSASTPMRRPARRSSLAWANCTWK